MSGINLKNVLLGLFGIAAATSDTTKAANALSTLPDGIKTQISEDGVIKFSAQTKHDVIEQFDFSTLETRSERSLLQVQGYTSFTPVNGVVSFKVDSSTKAPSDTCFYVNVPIAGSAFQEGSFPIGRSCQATSSLCWTNEPIASGTVVQLSYASANSLNMKVFDKNGNKIHESLQTLADGYKFDLNKVKLYTSAQELQITTIQGKTEETKPEYEWNPTYSPTLRTGSPTPQKTQAPSTKAPSSSSPVKSPTSKAPTGKPSTSVPTTKPSSAPSKTKPITSTAPSSSRPTPSPIAKDASSGAADKKPNTSEEKNANPSDHSGAVAGGFIGVVTVLVGGAIGVHVYNKRKKQFELQQQINARNKRRERREAQQSSQQTAFSSSTAQATKTQAREVPPRPTAESRKDYLLKQGSFTPSRTAETSTKHSNDMSFAERQKFIEDAINKGANKKPKS